MKKHNGFTIIELLVGVAVSALIFGAVVAVFRGGITAMFFGQKQEVVYANARAVMNDITTTLKYADTDKIQYTSDSKITYEGTGNAVTIIGTGNPTDTVTYTRTIEWEDSNYKRLKITKIDNGKTTIVYFPEKQENSAFSTTDYFETYNNLTGNTASKPPFPVFVDQNSESSAEDPNGQLYDVVLPVQYTVSGITKIDILRSKVNTNSKSFAQDATGVDRGEQVKGIANSLAIAVTTLFNTDPTQIKTKAGKFTSNISSAGLTRKEGAETDPSLAGAANNVWNSLSSDERLEIGKTSWVIVPCGTNDKFLTGNNLVNNKIDHWKIFIARNVIDDIPDPDTNLRLYDTTDHGEKAIDDLGKAGTYILRPDYGLITYCFTTKGKDTTTGLQVSDLVSDKVADTYGYATGVHYASGQVDVIYINYNKWVSAQITVNKKTNYKNYKVLQTSTSKYIEDYPNGKTGERDRIDYDGAGNEYVLNSHPSTTKYDYPPAMSSDTTDWYTWTTN